MHELIKDTFKLGTPEFWYSWGSRGSLQKGKENSGVVSSLSLSYLPSQPLSGAPVHIMIHSSLDSSGSPSSLIPCRQELCLFYLVIIGSVVLLVPYFRVKQEACWWLPFTPSSWPLPGLSGRNCPRQHSGTSKSLCTISSLLFFCRCLMCLEQIYWPSPSLTAR